MAFVLAAMAWSDAGFAGTRPFAAIEPLELRATSWTDGFWAERLEVCRTKTVPAMWRIMSGTDYSHYLENFRIAAGAKEGRYRGAPFNDGELYKWLEAASLLSAAGDNGSLRAAIDESVETIARAQREDGYLHTQVLVRARKGEAGAVPFQDRNNFELYNLGHLMSTACVLYQTTGDTRLMDVARRAADFLEATFEGVSPEAARSSVCPSHFMGLVDLYRDTGEARYLKLAQTMFASRSQVTGGGDDNQDRIPFENQRAAMGHAVRANYLYAGAADLYMETGDISLWQPLEPIWQNLTARKMFITGACGALYDGASPFGSADQRNITRTHQAYGHDYELPNVTAHGETCANIGNVLWNWRMFLATGEARFMDVLELALYNSVLSGVSLEGTEFLYTNPLRVTDPLPTELRWPRSRVPHLGSFCCAPNLARTVAKSANFAYARSPQTIWVNLYGGSTLTTEIEGVGPVRLTQETDYPWDGRVRITVDEAGSAEFTLKLRIPEWANGARVWINENAQTLEFSPGDYASIARRWNDGDVVALELPMHARLIEAHPLVEETLNQLAVKRGPIVFCLESADLPEGVRVGEVRLPSDIRLTAVRDAQLLDGVVVLEGIAKARPHGDWHGILYRELQELPATEVNIRMIPYFAWGNRGKGEMTVWLPRAR